METVKGLIILVGYILFMAIAYIFLGQYLFLVIGLIVVLGVFWWAIYLFVDAGR